MASLREGVSALFQHNNSSLSDCLSSSDKAAISQYPFTSQSFDPALANGEHIQWLLEHEMSFAGGQIVEYFEAVEGKARRSSVAIGAQSREYRLEEDIPGGIRALWVSSRGFMRGTDIESIVKQNWESRMKVPLSRDALIKLLEDNDVPPHFLEIYSNNNGGTWSYTTFDAYHLSVKFPFGPSVNGAFYLRYSFKTTCTTCISFDSSRRNLGARLEQIFQSPKSPRSPEVVNDPFLVISAILHEYSSRTEMERSHLDRVVCHHEAKTGVALHSYDKSRYCDISEYSTFKRDLHVLDAALVAFDRVCAFQVEVTNLLHRERVYFIQDWKHQSRPQWLQSVVRGTDRASASLLLSTTLAEKRLGQLRTLRQRVQIQLSVVDSSIRQYDSLTNISIAKDSRKDSVAMKTIAVLGMIFLPASFIASFFGMVFFQSTTANGSIIFTVSPHLWLYFAITIPLTIAVVCTWIGWAKWKDQENDEHIPSTSSPPPQKTLSSTSSFENAPKNRKHFNIPFLHSRNHTQPKPHGHEIPPSLELGPVFEVPSDGLLPSQTRFGPCDPGASVSSIAKPFTRITYSQASVVT